MQEADELVDKTGHALLPPEVGAHHVEVADEGVLKRSRKFRPEDVGHEQLHDAEAHGEEGHVVPRPEEGEVVLGAALQRCRDQRQVA